MDMIENERVLKEIGREPGVAELMELYERIERVYAPASAAALPFGASATSDSTNRTNRVRSNAYVGRNSN